jgi:hypothetical protein
MYVRKNGCVILVFLCYKTPEDDNLFVETYVGALMDFIHVFYLVHLLAGIRFMTRCTVHVI